MAQGKKTPSEKIADVCASRLSNPDASLRDIKEKTGVNHQTVSDILEENLADVLTSSDNAKSLFDYNVGIIAEGARKIELAMKRLDPETIRDTKEYQEIVNTAFKQNELISMKGDKGDNTIIIQI